MLGNNLIPMVRIASNLSILESTVVPGFSVLGFRALPGFRAQKLGTRAWSVHNFYPKLP